MRQTLFTLCLVVLVAFAGCTTGSQYQQVGDAKVHVAAEGITLSKGETTHVNITVANSSDVEWVTLNVLEQPDGLDTQIHGKKLEPGETTTLEVSSEENVGMMTVMVPCGKAMCPVMVPIYDGHDVTIGMLTSGNASEKVNIEVSA